MNHSVDPIPAKILSDELHSQSGVFEEDNGNKSSMRMMCFISLCASITFGLITLLHTNDANGLYLTMMFLVGAFAPKAVQKFAETKIGG